MLPQWLSTVSEQDIEMDESDHDSPAPSPSAGFGSPLPEETVSQLDLVAKLKSQISSLAQENTVLRGNEEYVLRKLSRNGQGTVSNIETVTDRAVRQREQLRVENEELRVEVQRLESSVTHLQGIIAHTEDKLKRAVRDREEMIEGRHRWIARVWALAGRLPGELRKKDAEIENMREKLTSMFAQLAQEQSKLREAQGELDEERTRRMGVEAELQDANAVHDQKIKERDLAGQKLRDQLKQMVNGLDSGAIAI
jgi:chromosome segregation ATPase